MKETEAVIERVKRINADYQSIELAIDDSMGRIKPGHSLLALTNPNGWSPYMRERWWPIGLNGGKLIIERPGDIVYTPGQIVNVMGFVGQPYRFRRTLRNVLLVAYNTVPTPLLLTIPWLLGNKISVTIVLTGTATQYNTQHLAQEVEVVRGDEDNFSWSDQVMTAGWADQVFVVVNPQDEMTQFTEVVARFTDLRNDLPQNYLFGVFQLPIPCGAGACYACSIPMRKGAQLACTEGPALDLTQVILT